MPSDLGQKPFPATKPKILNHAVRGRTRLKNLNHHCRHPRCRAYPTMEPQIQAIPRPSCVVDRRATRTSRTRAGHARVRSELTEALYSPKRNFILDDPKPPSFATCESASAIGKNRCTCRNPASPFQALQNPRPNAESHHRPSPQNDSKLPRQTHRVRQRPLSGESEPNFFSVTRANGSRLCNNFGPQTLRPACSRLSVVRHEFPATPSGIIIADVAR